jgi:hypothetical protein
MRHRNDRSTVLRKPERRVTNPSKPPLPDGERCPATRWLAEILGPRTAMQLPDLEFRCSRARGHDGEHRGGPNDAIRWWDEDPEP